MRGVWSMQAMLATGVAGLILGGVIGALIGRATAPARAVADPTAPYCRPSAPDRAVAAAGLPAVLLWGNSQLHDSAWRFVGATVLNCARQGLRADAGLGALSTLPMTRPAAAILAFGAVEALQAAARGSAPDTDAFEADMTAMLRALRRRWPDAALVGDGPERTSLEALAARLGIAGAVDFSGYLSQAQVADRLSRADVFALPSFAEGVPVVLMEAMASRLPVIAPRVAGVPELVEDGVSGFTVSPGDAEMLTARIDALLSDPALRARMGDAGHAKVAAEFDQAAEAAWLKRLIAGSHASTLPDGLRPAA
jgi:hypothetical protein